MTSGLKNRRVSAIPSKQNRSDLPGTYLRVIFEQCDQIPAKKYNTTLEEKVTTMRNRGNYWSYKARTRKTRRRRLSSASSR